MGENGGMNVINETPLVVTAVSVTTNPETMTNPGVGGTSRTAFPVTVSLSQNRTKLVVDATLISSGVLKDGETPMYTASCTGRIAFTLESPLDKNFDHDEVFERFAKPVYFVLSDKLQQLIMSVGLVVTFPLATPPKTKIRFSLKDA